MKLIIFLIATLAALTTDRQPYEARKGDLIFQVACESEFSTAIADATARPDSVRLSHVAIIDLDNDGNPYIIEASSNNGVCLTEFDKFIKEAPLINKRPGIIIKRLKINFPVQEALSRAKDHLGEPYDWSYYPDNNMSYCSELVFESYLDKDGKHIFKSAPMNFKDKKGEFPSFWKELFLKAGIEIPQGIEGTNPNDMFADPNLVEVCRFF